MFFVRQMRSISRRPVETFGHWGFLPWIVHYGLGRIVLRMLGHLWPRLGLVTKMTLSSTTVMTSQYPGPEQSGPLQHAALHDGCMTAAWLLQAETRQKTGDTFQNCDCCSQLGTAAPANTPLLQGKASILVSNKLIHLSMEMRAVSCVKRYTDRCVVF